MRFSLVSVKLESLRTKIKLLKQCKSENKAITHNKLYNFMLQNFAKNNKKMELAVEVKCLENSRWKR